MSNQKILKEDNLPVTESEIAAYLESILKGDKNVFGSELETTIAENFAKGKRQYEALTIQLKKLRQDLEQGEKLLIELGGRIDENARLLIMAFEKRREEEK